MAGFVKKFAVIVGVSTYARGEHISELKYANADAIQLYRTLVQHCGFGKEQIRLLVNGHEEDSNLPTERPNKANVLNAIQYVADTATENDLVLMYFAGHGAEVSESPYLITEDTRLNVVRETAIDVSDLNDKLQQSRAQFVLRIFDACRAPFMIGRGFSNGMTEILERAILRAAKGWATLSACSSGESSYESTDLGHGVFSYYLCEGLAGKAKNTDGAVTLESLMDYVRYSVANWCDSQSLKQSPHVQSDVSGVLELARFQKQSTEHKQAPNNPLFMLTEALHNQLAGAPEDVRTLQFTTPHQLQIFSESAKESARQIVDEFGHDSIAVSVSDFGTLKRLSNLANQTLEKHIGDAKLGEERTGNIRAFALAFSSLSPVIPPSSVYVVAVQFRLFFWLWYMHECGQSADGKFAPKPPFHTGRFALKASAALRKPKVEEVLHELIGRCAGHQLEWASQLTGHIDARLQPIRDIEDMIE